MILYRISNRDLLNVLFLEASKLKIPLSIKSENKGVRVMTVHKSKGLQAKAVFVLDVVSGLYGFPCELENPDVMAVVNEKVVHYQEKNREERRLFYVAITRAKDDLFIYTKKGSESLFLKDLEYFSVKHALKENYFSSKNTKYNYF
ncbi:MAG TPA: 3'-5' exonuclease, partial [bacterium]|nr:3'-5' exonuclease [bacterium]